MEGGNNKHQICRPIKTKYKFLSKNKAFTGEEDEWKFVQDSEKCIEKLFNTREEKSHLGFWHESSDSQIQSP